MSSTACTSVDPFVLADINRDGAIDDADAGCQIAGTPFRFWTNEDTCKGDYIGATNDVSPNASDFRVNGKLDLVNLFPVKVDLERLHDAWDGLATIKLRAWTDNLRYCVLGDLASSDVSRLQTAAIHNVDDGLVESTALTPLDSEGVDLDDVCEEGQHTLMLAFEAAGPVNEWNGPEVVVSLGDSEVFSYRLPLRIASVRDMYRWLNVRDYSGESVSDQSLMGEPVNAPYDELSDKNLLFLHGANVSLSGARTWMDSVFKRLWLSGSRARFVGVTWRSDIGTSANYQQNASNAFEVATYLAPQIAAIPGAKVLMAHSLGNMVCSSMIQDHGLQVERFLMCNSAVPSEAYCGADDESIRVPQLVHPEWTDYPTNTWASNWHKLFREDAGDDRKHLGWPARFADVAAVAVNFYSTGDEVLELYPDNTIGILSGITTMWTRYCWHCQEMWKGRAFLVEGFGGTDWSGWAFNTEWVPTLTTPVRSVKYTSEDAALLTVAQIKSDPVFNPYPESVTNSVLPLLLRAAHLTRGIPALAQPTGRVTFGGDLMSENMFDLNDNDGGLKSGQWPSRSGYGTRWLHSDMKDVAYYYNFMFYKKVAEKGNLK